MNGIRGGVGVLYQEKIYKLNWDASRVSSTIKLSSLSQYITVRRERRGIEEQVHTCTVQEFPFSNFFSHGFYTPRQIHLSSVLCLNQA